MTELRFKKFSSQLESLKATGDWIDVRVADVIALGQNSRKSFKFGEYPDALKQDFPITKGEAIIVRHGFALELPKKHEALLRPRGSLFKKTGLIFTCSGVIDEGFNGDHDEWFSTYYATRDVVLHANDRVAQFRILKKQPVLSFKEVKVLGNSDRGGLGSTGGYHN